MSSCEKTPSTTSWPPWIRCCIGSTSSTSAAREGVNLINRRYHELKIQLARIREEQDQAKQNAAIAAIEQNIRQYEAENKTGNPVLDTILTAKTMACQQENITITSVADGRMLGFLTIRELCTIVGVALDNAIAAVRAEPDPEKRLVKVAVYSQGGFAMLRFEHYTETAPALEADGLPAGDRPEKRPHRRPAARRQHDAALGKQLVHPADLIPAAQKQINILRQVSPAVFCCLAGCTNTTW